MGFLWQEVGPEGVVRIAIFLAVVFGLLLAIIIAVGYRIKKRLGPTSRKKKSETNPRAAP